MIRYSGLTGKVGMYLRLSREDGDKLESDSIRFQRELLTDFLSKNKGLKFVKEYVDDGYSGTTFNRPHFQEMLEDAKRGRINCVLVKDLSRFGRNYIETGRFLERTFPAMGCRLIAVNDNYDSMDTASDENQIIVPFKNLINDAYCRDISIKIRSHLDVKRKDGQFIGSFAGYGYKKDPDDKNHLIVDEYAASVVEMIFDMKLSGMGNVKIAEKLDEMGIQPPYEYKRKCGFNYNSGFRSTDGAKWPVDTVLRILTNRMYTGTMVQGKTRKINYKVKKSIPVAKEDWLYVSDTHDAIVSQSKFDAVQELLRLDTRTPPENDYVYALSGYVKCVDCSQNMVRRSTVRNGKKYYYYHCSTYKSGAGCSSHIINCNKVENAVLVAVQKQIELLDKIEPLLKMIDEFPNDIICVRTIDKQMEKLKENIEYYGVLKAKLYKDMVDGVVSAKEYKDLHDRFDATLLSTEKSFYELEAKKEDIITGQVGFQPWIEEIKKYRNVQSVSREMVVALLDKVVVESTDKIQVHFLFDDEMEELIKYSEMQISNKDEREA